CVVVSLLFDLSAVLFFFSSRRRHTRFSRDWSSDVCSSDLPAGALHHERPPAVDHQRLDRPPLVLPEPGVGAAHQRLQRCLGAVVRGAGLRVAHVASCLHPGTSDRHRPPSTPWDGSVMWVASGRIPQQVCCVVKPSNGAESPPKSHPIYATAPAPKWAVRLVGKPYLSVRLAPPGPGTAPPGPPRTHPIRRTPMSIASLVRRPARL